LDVSALETATRFAKPASSRGMPELRLATKTLDVPEAPMMFALWSFEI
jgi:hypothetical protein